MKPSQTLPTDYFDDMYKQHDDPWNFKTSEYEREKYKATIAALPKAKYENVFEIGCSIGVLTERLAPKCHSLLSVDVSVIAIEQARKRLSAYPQVRFKKMEIPKEFPEELFDCIIMSEVGYYLSIEDLTITQQLIVEHLSPGAHLLMVHWTPIVHDYPLTGDQVHESFLRLSETGKPLKLLFEKREEKYRINLFEKV
ncbi:MAG: SAM-dependent methyltransferase [Chitinophagaceae bacterium]